MFPTLMNEQRHRKRHVLLPILSAASLKHAMPHSPFFHLLLALAHVHRAQLAPLERRQRYYRDTSAYISDPIYPLVPIHLCVSAANNRERASRAQRPRKGPCSALEAESAHHSRDSKINQDTHIHTYIHTYMHACMHVCMHTYIRTYIHT